MPDFLQSVFHIGIDFAACLTLQDQTVAWPHQIFPGPQEPRQAAFWLYPSYRNRMKHLLRVTYEDRRA